MHGNCMDGHDLWLEQCERLGFHPAPRRYAEGTRTSQDAAEQLGCEVAHIAKSIVFEGAYGAVVVITSGANRVDRKKKLKHILGYKPGMGDADYIIKNTGYAPGGVPPFGHLHPCTMVMDQDLLQFGLVWGAAGSEDTVFPITPQDLQLITQAQIGDVKQ
jgi:prolyl-tRNA editing enzyme YbaK/EbsC (Cys-tRNA(Pro) deacylase)